MQEGEAYSPELLLEAAQVLSRSLVKASLETLEGAHELIRDYFHAVVETGSGTHENAAEQRLIGLLWAEIEVALDARRKALEKED